MKNLSSEESREEEERLAEVQEEPEANASSPTPTEAPCVPSAQSMTPIEPIQAVDVPEIIERTTRVRGTLDQIVALGNWMNENGIDFEKI